MATRATRIFRRTSPRYFTNAGRGPRGKTEAETADEGNAGTVWLADVFSPPAKNSMRVRAMAKGRRRERSPEIAAHARNRGNALRRFSVLCKKCEPTPALPAGVFVFWVGDSVVNCCHSAGAARRTFAVLSCNLSTRILGVIPYLSWLPPEKEDLPHSPA